MGSRPTPLGLRRSHADARHDFHDPSAAHRPEIWLGKGRGYAGSTHGRQALALLFIATTANAFTGTMSPHAPRQRRGLHKNSNACGPGLQKHCMKVSRPRTKLRGFAPRMPGMPGNREAFSMGGIAVDDAASRFYGEPTEDLAKIVLVGGSMGVVLAAVLQLPSTGFHLSAHTISGATAGMAAVVLLGNPLFGGSFGASVNKSYQNLLPLLAAAFNKGVVCGTYAAAHGAMSTLAPVASVTAGIVKVGIAAMVTALAASATEVTVDSKLLAQIRGYRCARAQGTSRLAALRQLWAQRSISSIGGRKAFWSATKLNVCCFQVFHLTFHFLETSSPWIGATVFGHAIGGAIAGASYAASMALSEALSEASRGKGRGPTARLRLWVGGMRARASEMRFASLNFSFRFACYKAVFDSMVRA
ncbi:hypothetical protein T484DRAFT_3629675 [Baffinella frigidus]|nr:hypothetical protein T484DRAFT_3629675 [Cryptophyta sp. CCMP2293]